MKPGWWQLKYFSCHPENWGRWPFWRAYFSDEWLNHQPETPYDDMQNPIFRPLKRLTSRTLVSYLKARWRYSLGCGSWPIFMTRMTFYTFLGQREFGAPHPKINMKRTVKPGWFGSDDFFLCPGGPVFSGEPTVNLPGCRGFIHQIHLSHAKHLLTFHCNGWLILGCPWNLVTT